MTEPHTAEKNIQEFWRVTYPQAEHNVGIKLLFLRGMLSSALVLSDGDYSDKEFHLINKLPKQIIGDADEETHDFIAGFQCHQDTKVSNQKILALCSQLTNKSNNRNTIKMLLRISAADGLLDKGEYMFIHQAAQQFELNIPSFDDLAKTLNLDTSNLKKEKMIRTTGKVASTIGKGVIVVGGFLLKTLIKILDENNNSEKSNETSTKKILKTKGLASSIKSERCVSCAFWKGTRELNNSGVIIYVNTKNNRCVGAHGPFKKQYVSASSRCNAWQRWSGVNG